MGSSKKSKKKQKEKKKRRKSSSSDSSSSEDEWVEAGTNKETKSSSPVKSSELKNETVNRDDWMSEPLEFSGQTREQLRKKKEPKEDESKYMLDRIGRTDRELNPYWKDGGTGLPEQVKELSVSEAAVGDYGVEWLRKALRRSKEQAVEEGRPLEDVVAERWGSLEKLQSMIKDAESRSSKQHNSSDKYSSYDKYKDRGGHSRSSYGKDETQRNRKGFRKPEEYEYNEKNKDSDRYRDHYSEKAYERRPKDKQRTFMRPDKDEDRMPIPRDKRDAKKFMRPSEDDDDVFKNVKSYDKSGSYSRTGSSKGWRKVSESQTTAHVTVGSSKIDNKCEEEKVSLKVETDAPSTPVYLTADERNELAAKLIKAEIMGNTVLVEKLKAKLDEARLNATKANEEVALTVTDSKGFVQPLALSSKPESGKRRKEKLKTHEDGKRVRYFADDDKYSLQDMFQQEKSTTIQEQNDMFAKLAAKNMNRDDTNEMDEVFEDSRRLKDSDGKSAMKQRDKAIGQYKRNTKALDTCQWCLDGKRLLKHLVVSIGSKVFLCLPPFESLTEGHCMLVPTQHVACATQLDEDVWEELKVFRKALVDLFLSMDLDVIFFECAVYLSRLPHMVLQCVPLPKESGDLAPIYFKKAILDCEMEWATNKKLVDLAGKDVRRAIPRGLPYFAVDFGMQSGFAHVIEDEAIFPRNFAQEIIGGMIDADHSLWRKPKVQGFEEQRKKVMAFTKWWQPFNCVKS